MRRLLSVLVLAIAGLFLLPVAPAAAACVKPPGRSSSEGILRIRTHPIVITGFVDGENLPVGVHGVYSFKVNVTRYLAGAGPRSIQVTNYGNLAEDLHEGYEQPGNAKSRNRTLAFLRSFAGQNVILFLTANDDALGKDTKGQYKSQYATNGCLYNAVGTKDYNAFIGLLTKIFAAPPPTVVPTSGPTSTAAPTDAPSKQASDEPTATESRTGTIVRAGALIALVGASLLLYRSPRSPLFERWRSSSLPR